MSHADNLRGCPRCHVASGAPCETANRRPHAARLRPPKLRTPIVGTTAEGVPIIAATIERRYNRGPLLTFACEFCEGRHSHGYTPGDSPRGSHCLVPGAWPRDYVLRPTEAVK
jgi:hypothetical protein